MKPQTIDKDTEAEKKKDHLRNKKACSYVCLIEMLELHITTLLNKDGSVYDSDLPLLRREPLYMTHLLSPGEDEAN